MPLKATLTKDEHASLDDALKSLYKQSGENFILDAEGVEDVTGLKSALAAERKKAAEFEKLAKKFEGMDVDKINAALEFQRKADEKKLADKGEFEKIRLQDQEKHKSEIEKINAEVTKWKSTYLQESVGGKLKTALIAAGVLPEAIEDATRALMPSVKSEMTDNGVEIKFMDEHGLDSGKSLDETVKGFKDSRKYFFAATGAAGSGAETTQKGVVNGTVSASDQAALNANIEGLASGKIKVVE